MVRVYLWWLRRLGTMRGMGIVPCKARPASAFPQQLAAGMHLFIPFIHSFVRSSFICVLGACSGPSLC